MRKIIGTILTFILAVVLMINFARLLFYPAENGADTYTPISTGTVLAAVQGFNVKDPGVLRDFSNIANLLLSTGTEWINVFSGDSPYGNSIFGILRSFFNAVWSLLKNGITILGGLFVLFINIVRYFARVLYAIYKFINVLFGWDLPVSVT